MEVDTSIRERTTLHFLDEHVPFLVVPMLLLPTPTLTMTREVEVAVDKCCNLQYLMAGMNQRWGMNHKPPQGEVDGEVRSKKVNSALVQVHEVVAPCPRCKALSMAVEISVGRRGRRWAFTYHPMTPFSWLSLSALLCRKVLVVCRCRGG